MRWIGAVSFTFLSILAAGILLSIAIYSTTTLPQHFADGSRGRFGFSVLVVDLWGSFLTPIALFCAVRVRKAAPEHPILGWLATMGFMLTFAAIPLAYILLSHVMAAHHYVEAG